MNKFIVVMIAVVLAFLPQVVNAQVVEPNPIPEPPQHRIDLNYKIFLDKDDDLIFTPGIDVPIPFVELDCFSGGRVTYYTANEHGEVNEVYYGYEGNSWVCKTGVFVDPGDDSIELWMGVHIIISIDGYIFIDYPLALHRAKTWYVPLSMHN